MTIDSAVRNFVGIAVRAGLDMPQAGVTGSCPAAIVFKRVGVTSGCAFT